MKHFFLILVIISLFFALPISSPIWQVTPLPKLVQFPWRFLTLTTFSLAILSGMIPKKLAIVIAVAVIIFALPMLKITRTFHPESFYTTNDDTTTVQSEFMPKWVKNDPDQIPSQKIEKLNPTLIQINTVYFPGQEVFVDGKLAKIEYESNGLIRVVVTPGEHVVNSKFTQTPIHQIANAVSVIALLGIMILGAFRYNYGKAK